MIVSAPVLEDNGVSLGKFIVVWCLSAVINIGLLVMGGGVFFLINPKVAADGGDVVEVQETTEVEDVERQPDLTNTDLGLDDSAQLNFDNERIEEVSVPGQVDPTAPPGIVNAPETVPMNIPPPPGSAGGTGGAPLMAEAGTGSMAGTLGGMGGLQGVPGFGGRSGSTREKMVIEGGGNKLSEKSVADGLRWIALHQAQDGHWGLHDFNKHARTDVFPAGKIAPDNCQPNTNRRNDVAGTAFALLPFLAAGQTQKPPKTKVSTDYSKAVGAGLQYLVKVQDKSNSAQRGYFGGDMYSHGLATIAMCEAYGMTSDPVLKSSAQSALNYIVNAQDPAGGGWRYTPRTAGDTSVTGWQLMALKSGQMAGLTVPKTTLAKVDKFLDSCETAKKGGYGYLPGTPETVPMTSVALLCRQYLGVNPRNPGLQAGIKRLRDNGPGKTNNLYYEYYATQVMHHMGGEDWNFWNLGPSGDGKGGIRDTLITRQDKGTARAAQAGTWAGDDHIGGRLGATSLSMLTLEVYYRHLPLYRQATGGRK